MNYLTATRSINAIAHIHGLYTRSSLHVSSIGPRSVINYYRTRVIQKNPVNENRREVLKASSYDVVYSVSCARYSERLINLFSGVFIVL